MLEVILLKDENITQSETDLHRWQPACWVGRNYGKNTASEWVGCFPSLCVGAGLGCKVGVALRSMP